MQHIHVHVKEEEWEVIYRIVKDGKESKTYSGPFFWRGMCEADPDCTRASLVLGRLSLLYFVFRQGRQEIGG